MTTRKRNYLGKARPVERPYLVYEDRANGWTWKVLKSWQADNHKPYARWLCAVSSPMTYGGYDVGDVYVSEVTSNELTYIDDDLAQALIDAGEVDEGGSDSV